MKIKSLEDDIYWSLSNFKRQERDNTHVSKYMHKDVNGDHASRCQSVSELLNITSMMGDTSRKAMETE